MEIPQNIKNILSKRARAALNACARFCNNLCMGFGISFKRGDGYVVIGIDQPAILKWLKIEKFVQGGATAAEDAYSTQAADKASVSSSMLSGDHWDAGQFTDVDGNVVRSNPNNSSSAPKKTGVSFYAISRSQKVVDVDYLFFRKVTVNEHGVIAAMSAEEFAVAVADESAL